jgi:proline iminopeptidase
VDTLSAKNTLARFRHLPVRAFVFLEDEHMPASEGYIEVEDGVRLYYQMMGNGERPLVILNGFYLFGDFQHLAAGRTVIALDLRNRGRSDYIVEKDKWKGIHQDVDDIEAVRRYFEIEKMDLLAHSYAGIIPILYVMKHPAHVNRVVQISSMQPNQSTKYPAALTNTDEVLQQFFEKLGELQKEWQTLDPQEFCRKFWALLRPIYVFNPSDADKLRQWESCHLPTELNFMSYWMQVLLPSIQSLNFTSADLANVQARVLNVHGTKDRSAAYGGARDWALLLPDARLLTLENVAHVPWIEAPGAVFGAIQTFLDGAWPEAAEKIESLQR